MPDFQENYYNINFLRQISY